MGHATWDHYGLMLRTLKTYNISLSCSPDYGVEELCEPYEKSITFSSSPGIVYYRVRLFNSTLSSKLSDISSKHNNNTWLRPNFL